jgi:hypothetical protein
MRWGWLGGTANRRVAIPVVKMLKRVRFLIMVVSSVIRMRLQLGTYLVKRRREEAQMSD